jgi:hypothetical protein
MVTTVIAAYAAQLQSPCHHIISEPLAAADCLRLNVYLDATQGYAAQFPTAGVAEANGWHHLAPYIAGRAPTTSASGGRSPRRSIRLVRTC